MEKGENTKDRHEVKEKHPRDSAASNLSTWLLFQSHEKIVCEEERKKTQIVKGPLI